jgi:hypothetical protein
MLNAKFKAPDVGVECGVLQMRHEWDGWEYKT